MKLKSICSLGILLPTIPAMVSCGENIYVEEELDQETQTNNFVINSVSNNGFKVSVTENANSTPIDLYFPKKDVGTEVKVYSETSTPGVFEWKTFIVENADLGTNGASIKIKIGENIYDPSSFTATPASQDDYFIKTKYGSFWISNQDMLQPDNKILINQFNLHEISDADTVESLLKYAGFYVESIQGDPITNLEIKSLKLDVAMINAAKLELTKISNFSSITLTETNDELTAITDPSLRLAFANLINKIINVPGNLQIDFNHPIYVKNSDLTLKANDLIKFTIRPIDGFLMPLPIVEQVQNLVIVLQ